ncbi:hypothetical protein GWI33_020606 [Rhynchophorus ferrugineus]|uniref:Lipase domain-containing protein n=1 Tax=Rhynchophorus ferrugineus TaxID=354439 RepID=A0A834HRW6_RHYFE|nr:hypothetical protein GWI33_020606 [Rhynchophorus ferrugineus]
MAFRIAFVLILLFGTIKCDDIFDITDEQLNELIALKNLTEQLTLLNLTYELSQGFILYDDSDISFYVYTKNSTDGTKLRYDQSNRLSYVAGFDSNLRTVFIIHGWLNYYKSEVNTIIRAALLALDKSFNIISVDWSRYSYLLYSLSRLTVPKVGKTVALFINSMMAKYTYSADDIILIGHSLGAHVAGFAGKELNGTLGTILGLDPAGPLFFEKDENTRLYINDAKYVQAIHTNSFLFGVNFPIGTIDFWPNGGCWQPGCSQLPIVVDICSHLMAYRFMAESIGNNLFYARKCSSYGEYESGNCSAGTSALMGGLNLNISLSGDFYLKTNLCSPYGLEDI